MSTMTAHMRTLAPKILSFDQYTNPFVFKCEMDFFRKIRVRLIMKNNIKKVFTKQIKRIPTMCMHTSSRVHLTKHIFISSHELFIL